MENVFNNGKITEWIKHKIPEKDKHHSYQKGCIKKSQLSVNF